MVISVAVSVCLESSSSSHSGGVQALCLDVRDEPEEPLGAQVPGDASLRNGTTLNLPPRTTGAAWERCSSGQKP